LSSLQQRKDSPSAAATQLIASECGEKKLGGSAEAATPAAADDATSGDNVDLAKQEARTLPIANPIRWPKVLI
jgi:hypothetical protein